MIINIKLASGFKGLPYSRCIINEPEVLYDNDPENFYPKEEGTYSVEINSLEDFLSIIKEVGDVVILADKTKNIKTILVYDAYIE